MAGPVASGEVVQVSRFLDERGLSAFHVKLIVWTLLIAFADGYDIGAIAFAAPELVRSWHVDRGALGPVFSASLFGILFGSAIFGWVGDRYGRKVALSSALMLFGVFTVAAAYATDLGQMFWLRAFAGLGIGGIIPNIVAINAESAPRNLRAILPLVAVAFVPFGGALPFLVSWFLVPQYGWQALFVVGGIAPIVIAIAAFFGMPESIKYMALHESHRRKMVDLIAEIRPDFRMPANAKFVIEDEHQFPGFNPVYLFQDGLALITPLLWLLFALNLMGYFFLQSWTPTLLTAAHVPPTMAGAAAAVLQVGGTTGSLVLSRWINDHRFMAITIMFVLAVPAVASIGYMGETSMAGLMLASFMTGFFVLGIQSGINVAGALVYPTSLRANGSGWQLGIGRVGSIVGPLLGGLFVNLPVGQLYVWSSIPFGVAAVVCFTIHRLNAARLQERPWLVEAQPVAAE